MSGNGAVRVPPHDLIAEANLLGAALLSGGAALRVATVDPSDFYKPAHQHVAAAIASVVQGDGGLADVASVARELKRADLLDVVGGEGLLIDLQAACPAISNYERYAAVVTQAAARRRMVAALADASEAVFAEGDPAPAVARALGEMEALGRSMSPGRRVLVPKAPVAHRAILTGLPGRLAEMWEPHTEADPVAIAITFLAAFGNAVGPAPHLIVNEDRHPARIWPVLVGPTGKGGRKGTSFNIAVSPIIAADPGWEDRIRGGLSSGEGLIEAVANPVYNDDGDLVRGSEDRRLLAYEPEYGGTLIAAARRESTLIAKMRQSWDTGNLATLTRKPLIATGAHITVVAHVTEEELRLRLTSAEVLNGFANRHLLIPVRRSQVLAVAGQPSGSDLTAFVKQVRVALEAGRHRSRMALTPDAADLWNYLYSVMADDDPGGLVGAAIGRDSAQVLRLALDYALTDCAPAVDTPHVEAGYDWWSYARAAAGYLFSGMAGERRADELLLALRQVWPDGMSRTEVRDFFARHLTSAEMDAVLELLERGGLAVREVIRSAKAGRPSTVFRAVSP